MAQAMKTACVMPAPASCFVLRGAYGLLRRERGEARAAGPHERSEGRKVLISHFVFGASCSPLPGTHAFAVLAQACAAFVNLHGAHF